MLDIGGTELLLIAIVAIIVFDPADLPSLFRKAGRLVGQYRTTVRQITAEFENAAQAAEQQNASKLKIEDDFDRRYRVIYPDDDDAMDWKKKPNPEPSDEDEWNAKAILPPKNKQS